MSDNNLFGFPGESSGLEAGDIFGDGSFTDLGSADDGENPFAGMTPAEPETAPVQPAPQPVSTPAPPVPRQQPPFSLSSPSFPTTGMRSLLRTRSRPLRSCVWPRQTIFPSLTRPRVFPGASPTARSPRAWPRPAKPKSATSSVRSRAPKEFMDALKKSTDKRPKCIVKPTVKMQKKGEGTYKGIFPAWQTPGRPIRPSASSPPGTGGCMSGGSQAPGNLSRPPAG